MVCSSYRSGRLPFFDAFSATLWVCRPSQDWFTTGEILFNQYHRQQHQQLSSTADQTRSHDIPVVSNGSLNFPASSSIHSHDHERASSSSSSSNKNALPLPALPRVAAIFACDQTISAQLDHFQYLFLLRLVDAMTDMQKQVESDILRITGRRERARARVRSVWVFRRGGRNPFFS